MDGMNLSSHKCAILIVLHTAIVIISRIGAIAFKDLRRRHLSNNKKCDTIN